MDGVRGGERQKERRDRGEGMMCCVCSSEESRLQRQTDRQRQGDKETVPRVLVVIAGLESLEHLDLSENQLTSVRGGMWPGLHALRTLGLAHNWLSRVEAGALADLPALRTADLQHNELRTLPEAALAEEYEVGRHTHVIRTP